MDGAAQAEITIGRGNGGAIVTFFGAIWLALGLLGAGALSWWAAIVFALCCVGLYAGSLQLIRRGKKLRPPGVAPPRMPPAMRKGFLWAVVGEVAGCLLVVLVCNLVSRGELIPAGIALVVGLHFLPLARVFRAPVYYATGLSIAVWCAACLLLFRGPTISVGAAIGTGTVLWLTALYNIAQARADLRKTPGAAAPLPPEIPS